jgi:hypothetical protein
LHIVNRQDLRQQFEREGIQPTAYDLEPGPFGNDTYCLAIDAGGWSVFFAERGERIHETFFDTEDEACHELLLRVIGDPTTRRG